VPESNNEYECGYIGCSYIEVKLILQRGFSTVLDSPALVNSLALSLHTPNIKVRLQVVDLLSALCVLSANEGQPMVLDALAESALFTDETYRFEWLIRSLIPVSSEDADPGSWEWRTGALAFVNALVGASELLEDRCSLRGELHRRGLNEVLHVSVERFRVESWLIASPCAIDPFQTRSAVRWEFTWTRRKRISGKHANCT
jgi:hypothetical protein